MDIASLLSLVPLPPNVQRWIAFATVALTVLTALGKALDWVSPRLKAAAESMAIRAASTPGHLDDNAARGLGTIARIAAQVAVIVGAVVDLLRAIVPRASVTIAGRSSSSTSSRPPSPPAVLSALVFVLLATVSVGCGGPPRAVRSALDVSAHALSEADQIASPRYRDAAQEALAQSTSLDDYRARMRLWNNAETTMRTAAASLRAAEAAVDTWDAGQSSARDALACLSSAVGLTIQALTDAGLDPPKKLREAAGAVSVFAGFCPIHEVSR